MNLRNLWLAIVILLGMGMDGASMAHARPQLATSSIGWIDPSDIECPITSDHTCFVKRDAYTWTDQTGRTHKYRVKAHTDLVILNEGKDNEGSYPKDYDSNPNAGGYVHHKRVEVGIIIPADWGKDSNLHTLQPCHLKQTGSNPPIVSLACSKSSVQSGVGIGWVKNSDIECDLNKTCFLKNNYAVKGCVNYGIPVYSRPGGKPIGELSNEVVAGYEGVVPSENDQGYTYVSYRVGSKDVPALMPFNDRDLHSCG